MSVRQALAAAVLLLLVGAAWWLLADFAAAPVDLTPANEAPGNGTGEAAPAPAELPAGPAGSDYPAGYVDDLPLTDAPPLPDDVTKDYAPAFERPDLIGDGMLVPLEFDLGEPQLPDSADDAP